MVLERLGRKGLVLTAWVAMLGGSISVVSQHHNNIIILTQQQLEVRAVVAKLVGARPSYICSEADLRVGDYLGDCS